MLDRVSKADALKSPETLATVIHAIVLQQYGEEAYTWDPLTVYMELQADFGIDCDSVVTDRWSAIQVVMTNDAFFKRPEAFMGIANTLADGQPFFDVFNPVSTEEAAWAITEVSLQRELLPFSYAIKTLLKETLKKDGYNETNYPDIFKEVFGPHPKAGAIRVGLGALDNNDLVEAFILDRLKDLGYQLGRINSLKTLDDIILRKNMEEFVGPVVEGQT